MILSIIVAQALDRAIGRDNDLLWRLSADLRRFRRITTGHSILMGRRTWLSLPNGALPNRRNIIISQTLTTPEGAEVYPDVDTALSAVADEQEVFVIGGGMLYEALLPRVDRIYLTEVQATYPDADTHFPELDMTEWREVARETVPADEANPLASSFVILERTK